MGRCPACPVPAGSPCFGGFLCGLAATGEPHWLRHVAERAKLPPPGVMPPATAPPPARPPVAAVLAELAKVRACPHWSRPDCGCRQGLCAFPWRRRFVSFDDCRDCLRSRGA